MGISNWKSRYPLKKFGSQNPIALKKHLQTYFRCTWHGLPYSYNQNNNCLKINAQNKCQTLYCSWFWYFDLGILFSHRFSYCQMFGPARYVGFSLDKVNRWSPRNLKGMKKCLQVEEFILNICSWNFDRFFVSYSNELHRNCGHHENWLCVQNNFFPFFLYINYVHIY